MSKENEPRWYVLGSLSIATLCADKDDAEACAVEYAMTFPLRAPYKAVQLIDASSLAALEEEISRLKAENEALRKKLVPLIDAEKHAMWVMATIDYSSHESCYLRGIADCEAAHGIGEKT